MSGAAVAITGEWKQKTVPARFPQTPGRVAVEMLTVKRREAKLSSIALRSPSAAWLAQAPTRTCISISSCLPISSPS